MDTYGSLSANSNNDNVCSTWGNGHYTTFAGHHFTSTGNCTYVFARDCNLATDDFKILIRRKVIGMESHVTDISMNSFFQFVEVNQTGVLVNHRK